MNTSSNPTGSKPEKPGGIAVKWLPLASGLFILLLIWIASRAPQTQRAQEPTASNSAPSPIGTFRPAAARRAGATNKAEEIVARKLAQFAASRRNILRAMAQQRNVEVPEEMERFFDAVASGKWEEIEAAYQPLSARRQNPNSSDFLHLFPPILETLGVAECVHDWPAQKLLDYGEATLGSLKPGMVYIGGTDPGRFIPTLLNETSAGDRHVVVTQNALADLTYLEYVRFVYGEQLSTLGKEDSDRVFQDYIADAQKRLDHDQQHPDEPKQVRPGEDIRSEDGRLQVSGQVSVMAVNEGLVRLLLEKNPDASFAIEQSFPLSTLYPETRLLGPIMELRVQDPDRPLDQKSATQAIDYWRETTRQLLSDPDAVNSREVRASYSKMAAEQAELMIQHGRAAEAEQAFQYALQISPSSPEAVYRYVNVLAQQKRFGEAIPVVEAALKNSSPNENQFRNLLNQLKRSNP